MFFSRGVNKIQNPYTIQDTYEFYIQDIGSNSIYYVDYNEYRDIVCDFYKTIVEDMLQRNVIFNLPFRLGTLSIIKSKLKLDRLNVHGVDWPKTVETGKYVYHLNEHSHGYKYTFYWNKKNKAVKNLYFYRLVPTRQNKRYLAKLIKSNKYDYFEKN